MPEREYGIVRRIGRDLLENAKVNLLELTMQEMCGQLVESATKEGYEPPKDGIHMQLRWLAKNPDYGDEHPGENEYISVDEDEDWVLLEARATMVCG